MKITKNTPVGEIVAQDIHKAKVLNQFHIDFCCGGDKSLGEACGGE